MEAGERLSDVTIAVSGRVRTKRASGAKLLFYDIFGQAGELQVSTC